MTLRASVAHALPRELSALIGYSRENGSLGYFGEGQDPEDALIAAAAGQWNSQAAVEGVASVSSRSRQKPAQTARATAPVKPRL